MKKFIEWHQNMVFKFMVKLNLGVYEIAWISWIKGLLMGAILTLLCSCGAQFEYRLLNSAGNFDAIYGSSSSSGKTEIVYLDELKKDTVNLFTSLEFKTITLDFRPRFYRDYNWYWGRNYNYWGYRPLWLDFDYYWHHNYFTYSPYFFSYYRPWNYWDWYMRPWRPWNNWYQGPFNNSSYNVVYNASRRGSLTSNLNRSISSRIQTNRLVNINKRPVNNNAINTLINNYKPNNSNNYKPSNSNNNIIVKPNNNWKPSNNNYKPNNNFSRPSNNYSRPSNNYSRPSNNVISRPSTPSRGVKINRE